METRFNPDPLDRRILAELQKNAALSNAELAARVASTAPSCWRRIRQMEDAGVLQASVWLADRKSLGLSVKVICHVRMRSHTAESIEAFERFAAAEPHILECYSMSGEWDYLLQVVSEDVEAYEHFLMNRILKHPSVGGASSHFALRTVKYTTALPCR